MLKSHPYPSTTQLIKTKIFICKINCGKILIINKLGVFISSKLNPYKDVETVKVLLITFVFNFFFILITRQMKWEILQNEHLLLHLLIVGYLILIKFITGLLRYYLFIVVVFFFNFNLQGPRWYMKMPYIIY